MNKLKKLFLALSCFSPLYLIFGLKNAYELYSLQQEIIGLADNDRIALLNTEMKYNWILLISWCTLVAFSILGVVFFSRSFLQNRRKSKEHVLLVKAKNITADYFFTYFSLFVLSFFTIDPTKTENMMDIIIFAILMIGMLVVYIRNDMFFINPVLNLFRYKSFDVVYRKLSAGGEKEDEQEEFDARVFSSENLNQRRNKKHYITFSPHDFSICYSDNKE